MQHRPFTPSKDRLGLVSELIGQTTTSTWLIRLVLTAYPRIEWDGIERRRVRRFKFEYN